MPRFEKFCILAPFWAILAHFLAQIGQFFFLGQRAKSFPRGHMPRFGQRFSVFGTKIGLSGPKKPKKGFFVNPQIFTKSFRKAKKST